MPTDDLRDAVRHLPDQVRDAAVAAAEVNGLPDPSTLTEIVVIGSGDGGVAGDVVESVAHLQGSLPVLATGASSPVWLRDTSLAVVVSQSGDNPPAIAAARAAQASGAAMVAVTSGGELMEMCSAGRIPVTRVDAVVGPAAGLGVLIVPVLVLLERLGALTGMNRLISEAAEQLEHRRRLLDADHSGIQPVADAVRNRIAVVCGAGGVGKHAARRWVQELDRVGGVATMRRNVPADDDEAQSWTRLVRQSRGGVTALVLRHDYEPEGVAGGVERLRGVVDEVHEIKASGRGALAQLIDLVLVGDAVAALAGARPAPAPKRG